jgi:multidrug efflux pump subunit AcrA (membrane-fusion protein)
LRTEPQRRLLRALWATGIVVFVWAAVFKLDKVTHATGRVIPSVENQVVQHLEGGIIAEVLVTEGARVAAGQVVMRITDQFTTADAANARTDVVSRQIRLARLEAEIGGAASFAVDPALARQAPHIAESETGLFVARRSQLSQELAVIESQARAHRSEIASIEARLQSLRAEEEIPRRATPPPARRSLTAAPPSNSCGRGFPTAPPRSLKSAPRLRRLRAARPRRGRGFWRKRNKRRLNSASSSPRRNRV